MLVFLGSFIGSMLKPPGTGGVGGLTQRIFVTIFTTWLFLVGWHIRELGAAPAATRD